MRLGKNGFAKRLRRLVVRDCYAGARLLVCEQFRVIVAIESMEEARDDAGEAFCFSSLCPSLPFGDLSPF